MTKRDQIAAGRSCGTAWWGFWQDLPGIFFAGGDSAPPNVPMFRSRVVLQAAYSIIRAFRENSSPSPGVTQLQQFRWAQLSCVEQKYLAGARIISRPNLSVNRNVAVPS